MKKALKIVVISDTHGENPGPLLEADLLIHAGDWSGVGSYQDTNKFIQYLKTIRSRYGEIICVPGNHERWVEQNQALARLEFESAGVRLLIDETYEFEGQKIHGYPWTPVFGTWGFMADRTRIELLSQTIPAETNILISHGPPKSVLDRTESGIEIGCPALANRIQQLPGLGIHIFGHNHNGYGVQDLNGVLYVNAAMLDERYDKVNKAWTLSLDPNQTRSWK